MRVHRMLAPPRAPTPRPERLHTTSPGDTASGGLPGCLRPRLLFVSVPPSFAPRVPTKGPGKAVRNRRDPVTVIGDETRTGHWPIGWEGAGSRVIREPGDLPGRAPSTPVFEGGPGEREIGTSDSEWRRKRQQ